MGKEWGNVLCCGGGKGKCVGGVGSMEKYREVWRIESRCVEVCLGVGKCVWGVRKGGEGCWDGVGVGKREVGVR